MTPLKSVAGSTHLLHCNLCFDLRGQLRLKGDLSNKKVDFYIYIRQLWISSNNVPCAFTGNDDLIVKISPRLMVLPWYWEEYAN